LLNPNAIRAAGVKIAGSYAGSAVALRVPGPDRRSCVGERPSVPAAPWPDPPQRDGCSVCGCASWLGRDPVLASGKHAPPGLVRGYFRLG